MPSDKVSDAVIFLVTLCVVGYVAYLGAGGLGLVIAMVSVPIGWILQSVHRELVTMRENMNSNFTLMYGELPMATKSGKLPAIMEHLRSIDISLGEIGRWIRLNETEREEERRQEREFLEKQEKQKQEARQREAAERERAANVARFCEEFLTKEERDRLKK